MVVGRGGFGKVWIVTQTAKKRYYALKEMSKAKLDKKDPREKEHQLGFEREDDSGRTDGRFHCKHALRFSGPREPLPSA